jgi:sugar transferase (PEP-CTERM system associated)
MCPSLEMKYDVFVLSLIFCSAFLLVWHALLRAYFTFRRPATGVLILGTGGIACKLAKEVLQHPEFGLGVKGFVGDNPELVGKSIINLTVLGTYQDLPKIVSEQHVDRVVVAVQDRRRTLPIEALLNLKLQGITIEDDISFYERVSGKISIENLKPEWMIFNPGFNRHEHQMLLKQILSVAVALFLFILTLPILPLIMLLIKLDSPGPIFHRQKRVGQDGRVFTLWKFRSMRKDAEGDNGAVWAAVDDPRVTRVGKYLRRLRLDEFPQLLNIIHGDMTLVGPRPERPEFVAKLQEEIPFYSLRHTVKPGVTGWAQINYDYANTIEHSIEKLQYDLFYIKNMSWVLDVLIILETIKTVLVRRGS